MLDRKVCEPFYGGTAYGYRQLHIHTYIHLNHYTRAEHGAWSNMVILESGILISHDEKKHYSVVERYKQQLN